MAHEQIVAVDGVVTPQFQKVRDVFATSLDRGDELGGSVCVYDRGQIALDIWGGFRNLHRSRPWQRDTIVCMMSVAKAMASLTLLVLVDQGAVNLDAPIARYWPGFAQQGKDNLTIRQLLGHRTGVLFADAAPVGSLYDWDVVVEAIERQPPEWPAARHGVYQSFTHGFLVGEIVRRVTGLTLGDYFRQRIAIPLGVDFHIGVPEADLKRVSDLNVNPENITWGRVRDLSTVPGRAWRPLPRGLNSLNTDAFRLAQFPSASGHGNAASVARVFAALGNDGILDGVRILSSDTVSEIGKNQWENPLPWDSRDFPMSDQTCRMGLGMFMAQPGILPMGPNLRSYGHPGIGGALGFVDPDRKITFSYATSIMCEGAGSGRRCQALVDALYESLQYGS